ncbi:hypothetical protein AB4037_29070 [Labrys sp. KB_33_2]|uniref:hypothetical protein n=1 Tax=Labrys sp. KB_33_2 TaxID=3237479 RepID=UPI003F91C125
MTRIRKAYTYQMLDDCQRKGPIYAPDTVSARSQLYSRLADCWSITFRGFLGLGISYAREPAWDVALPDRHPLASELSQHDLSVISHAYGGTGPKAGWRDHFFTAADDQQLCRLADAGLFERDPLLDGGIHPSGSAYFILTDLGRAVAAGEQSLYEFDVEIRHAERLKRKAAKRKAEAA